MCIKTSVATHPTICAVPAKILKLLSLTSENMGKSESRVIQEFFSFCLLAFLLYQTSDFEMVFNRLNLNKLHPKPDDGPEPELPPLDPQNPDLPPSQPPIIEPPNVPDLPHEPPPLEIPPNPEQPPVMPPIGDPPLYCLLLLNLY